ncbi:MAG: acyloxyacyl hydrolase [Flavisolibacter sp.]|nr:acyloxyacyl hydrolase [Flavisolibacter sp.]
MKTRALAFCLWYLACLTINQKSFAQDSRTQYLKLLLHAYYEVNLGSIRYPFSVKQLEPGFSVESINIPHTAVRLVLFGYQFNKNLAAQITYMRPVLWVGYKNVNGDKEDHAVFMNIAGLTLKAQLPVKNKFSVYSEGGLGVITRSGFEVDHKIAVKDAGYTTYLVGGGLKYRLNNKFDLVAGATYTPANDKQKQPYTLFYSGGFTYHMQPVPEYKVKENAHSAYIFPKHLLQVGYTTNILGYGVNNFVSEGKIPIFWGGKAQVEKGIAVQYQQNVFHTRKVFSLDWGASAAYYKSKNVKNDFFTLSLFPTVRFTALRLQPLDVYFNYTAAGPTFISRTRIEGFKTGKNFTFYDFMGMGIYSGRKRNLNAELRIAHYSNGNLYSENAGVKIPLTINLGYAF